ncbi:hypothetical protein [Micromonospora zhanjiangensis]|uniref:SH3 domain-containing protein n=1 Tax=Micromonospora zhanjiangensis TaxID=1522057 RepID=A0ABV8KPW2_9ACTN
MLRKSKNLAKASAALLVAGIALPILPASASAATAAADCRQHRHQPQDDQLGSVLNADTPLRTAGPYSACPIVGRVQPGRNSLLYHCWVRNDVGNTWTWVTVRATGQQGWIYDGNLQFGGSGIDCL